jgi:hypothetical protein
VGRHEAALEYLQGTAIRTNYPLPPLYESFFIPHQGADFYNVASHGIIKDFDRLRDGNTSSQQFEQVASFKNDIWIECFTRCTDRHWTADQVKRAAEKLVQVNGLIGLNYG